MGLLSAIFPAMLAFAPEAIEAQTAQYSYAIATLGGGFQEPSGVAVDSSGNVYIADYGNSTVKKMPAGCGSSACVTTLGGGFANPVGVTVSASGTVYVADSGNNAVKEMPGSCTSSNCVASVGGGFKAPYGVALDASGNVYVADFGNNTVKKMAASCGSASCVTMIGGGFFYPVGVAVAASGTVYVGDAGNSAVKEMAAGCSTAACVATVGGGFNEPAGLVLDGNGYIYVADYGNNAVKKMSTGCASFSCVSTLGAGFSNPAGVALDASGNIYVADAGNGAVKKLIQGSVNYSSVQVGSSSAATLTFTFESAGTIAAPAVVTAGVANLDFTDAGTGTCDTNGTRYYYQSGNTCTVNVTFSPKFAGARYGAVNLLNNSAKVIATAYLYGTGVAPQVAFSPSTISVLGGGFSYPMGVTVDAGGNVYVADSKNAVMKEIPVGCTSSNCVKTLGGGFQVSLEDPFGVAVDGSGKVYFSDGALYAIPPGCTAASCVVEMGTSSMAPYGLAVDGSGNVYVADASQSAVWKIPPGCTLNSCTPAKLGGGFNQPHGVAVDANGNIYVADTNNNAVKTMAAGCASSSCVTNLGSGFSQPYGVATDAGGDIYVADFGNNAVKEMPAGCASSSCVATLASGFNGPGDVALDGSGNVYISDNGNSAVKEMGRASAPSLSFATTQAGQTSSNSPQTVTTTNIGNATLNLSGLSYGTDFPEASSVGTDCTSSTQLGLGSSCTLSIDFSPLLSSLTSASTSLSESVGLTDNALNATKATQTVGVSGMATAPPVTQLAFGTAPAPLIAVGGNAGSAVTVQEEVSGGSVATWTSDSITLTVTYPDNSVHTYAQSAVRGVASFNLSRIPLTGIGAYLYTASLTGASSAVASEVVGTVITPTITWNPAATIIFGSGGTNVLNAAANCVACGILSYTEKPSGGGSAVIITSTAGLGVGPYTIAAVFTPSGGGYLATSKTQTLTVSGESVWIMNRGGGTSELAGNGYAITSSADAGGSLAAAIDANGNVWSIGSGTTLLESVSQTGIVQHSIASGGGLNAPSAIAIDGNGGVWVTNAGNNSFSLFLNNGSAASGSTGFTDSSLSSPSGIAVDAGGSVWIANKGNNSVTRVLGAAGPAAPLSTAAAKNTTGAKP